jgi:3-hydroxyacyl-[acyl-carrier-protein] dehydratase
VNRVIEHKDIGRCLPQRYPFILVDRITDYEPHSWIRGIKNVARLEPMLMAQGDDYPRGLIVESIGQLAIALYNISHQVDRPRDILLGSLADVTFSARVRPGSRLELFARVERELDNGFVFSGEACIAGRCVLSLGSLIAVVKQEPGSNP